MSAEAYGIWTWLDIAKVISEGFPAIVVLIAVSLAIGFMLGAAAMSFVKKGEMR